MLENMVERQTRRAKVRYIDRLETMIDIGKQIAVNSLNNGASQAEALANITISALNANITELEATEICKVLKEAYRTSEFGSGFEELRKDVGNVLFPKHEIVSFNKTDLKSGFTHPQKLTFHQTYLMGIYRTDWVRPDANRIKLSGETNDAEFYKDIIAPMINNTFSINIEAKIIARDEIRNGKFYTWKDVYIEFTSKDHMRYLQDIGFIDEKRNFKPLDFDSINCIDHDRIIWHKEAYFASMVAGGGHMGLRKDKHGEKKYLRLEFKNQDMTYLPELKRMFEELNIHAEYVNSKSKPHFLYFTKDNIIRLAQHPVSVNLTPNQIGLITNPKHIEDIKRYL